MDDDDGRAAHRADLVLAGIVGFLQGIKHLEVHIRAAVALGERLSILFQFNKSADDLPAIGVRKVDARSQNSISARLANDFTLGGLSAEPNGLRSRVNRSSRGFKELVWGVKKNETRQNE